MPQMAPIFWIIMFSFFITASLMINMKMYFIILKKNNPSFTNNSIIDYNTLTSNWKW